MKIFITGIAGFVGSNVANKLYELGVEIGGIDNLSFGSGDNLNPSIQWRQGCISTVTKEELEPYDILLHMACSNIVFAINDPITTFQTNSEKSIQLFERFGTDKKIVYTGTSSIYGNSSMLPTSEDAPISLTNAYDTSKYITERYLRLRGNYTTLRLSNVYGRNQRQYGDIKGVIFGVLYSALSGENIDINGDGTQTRDFTYIDDAVDAIVKVCQEVHLNTAFNIGTGVEVSVNDIAKIAQDIAALHGVSMGKIVYIPRRANDSINRRCLDTKFASFILEWESRVGIYEGMNRTADWIIESKIITL